MQPTKHVLPNLVKPGGKRMTLCRCGDGLIRKTSWGRLGAARVVRTRQADLRLQVAVTFTSHLILKG
jgi:hypothetical protein